jgi:hypothetical protein
MTKTDIQGVIRHNERLKSKYHALNTKDADKKVVKHERIITQCEQVIKSNEGC